MKSKSKSPPMKAKASKTAAAKSSKASKASSNKSAASKRKPTGSTGSKKMAVQQQHSPPKSPAKSSFKQNLKQVERDNDYFVKKGSRDVKYVFDCKSYGLSSRAVLLGYIPALQEAADARACWQRPWTAARPPPQPSAGASSWTPATAATGSSAA